MGTAGRIVILDSSITALAVARCAHGLGFEAIICDSTAGVATASRRARAEIHPEPWRESTLARLRQLALGQRSLLIATSDAWLRYLMLHRAELECCYARILHPGNDVLAICLDKNRFSSWCETHGLPTPRRFLVDGQPATAENLPFPLLVRPAETLHSVPDPGLKALEVHSAAQLDAAIAGLARTQRHAVVSQSLLNRPLRQYSVGLARRGDAMDMFVARKLRPHPAACAPGTFVETAEDSGVEALARRLALLLDYQGIAEVEILQDTATGENFLIEMNPRPWLQFSLGAASGHDLLGLVALDTPRRSQRAASPAPVRWLDFRGDLRNWMRGRAAATSPRMGTWEFLHSMAAARKFARWSFTDQRPFWRDLLELLRLRPAGQGAVHRQTPHAGGSAVRPLSPR